MGSYDIEDDDDFDTDDEGSGTLRQLRKANREQARQVKALQEQLAKFQQKERSKTIGEILAGKNLQPKIASFYPKDAEADEASVLKWLDEYGDVFGIDKDQPPAVPPEDVAARRQMDSVGQAAGTQAGGQSIEALIRSAGSREELLKLIEGGG